ncbi:hypothetical protein R6Q59_009858 [Mikania micrantha]
MAEAMAFLVYRRPRAPSFKDTKQAISFERGFTRPASRYEIVKSSPKRDLAEPLLAFESLPAWSQDNIYVRAGYRQINNSYAKCLRSCTAIHNETMNILTHLIPAIGLILSHYSIQTLITQLYPDASIADRIVFGMNVLAATVTFSLSTLYHTLMCHSEQVSGLWLRFDYLGIITLILGSFYSGIYVGFYCELGIRNMYWSMITILGVVTATLVLHPSLQGVKYRRHKAYAFILTAITGFAPITHGLIKYGWSEMWLRSGMPYWLMEGFPNLGGPGHLIFGSTATASSIHW